MTRTIRRFVEAWRIAGLNLTYSLESDTEFGWNNDDAAKWRTFLLRDPTGQKMKAKLTNYVMRVAVAATKKPGDRDYHCGYARGCAMTVANLERLGEQVSEPEPMTEDEHANT